MGLAWATDQYVQLLLAWTSALVPNHLLSQYRGRMSCPVGARLRPWSRAGKDVGSSEDCDQGAGLAHMSSENILLQNLLSQVKAGEEEGAQVDGPEVALQHHLGHGSPHSRGMLQPMATEACSKVHVDHQGVGAYHAVLVEGVVVVVASPGAPNLWVHKMLES